MMIVCVCSTFSSDVRLQTRLEKNNPPINLTHVLLVWNISSSQDGQITLIIEEFVEKYTHLVSLTVNVYYQNRIGNQPGFFFFFPLPPFLSFVCFSQLNQRKN